ncbi:MAG: WbqC family protein [Desulfobacula sp.]|jgi:hypothetical protein
MNIAMMQPAFLPWQGFFELICKSDIFIFLDDFQFSRQSFQQRNRLFVNKNQIDWYSVPIDLDKSFKAPLNRTTINERIPWRKKILKRLEQNYKKAKFYDEIGPYIEDWLNSRQDTLADLNVSFIMLVCRLLKLDKEFRYSSQFPTMAKRSERVLELARWCKTDRYISAKGSFGYMMEDKVFPVEDIEVVFQNFYPQPYPQVCSTNGFEPFLSILDALLNIGSVEVKKLVENGSPELLPWETMEATERMRLENEKSGGLSIG